MSWQNFEELHQIIDDGYSDLGYDNLGDLGYRFLSSPKSTLRSDRLIMSINPAGHRPDYENDSMFTKEGTSAYLHERWMEAPLGSSKLQVQYQAMFQYLDWDPLDVLQAPFSPFRHPSWGKIPAETRNRTVDFCIEKIWKPYFEQHCPAEIISVGKPPAEVIIQAFPHSVQHRSVVETGWNNSACRTAIHYQFTNGTRMVQIPHLSRFGIMTASSCANHLEQIFETIR